MCVRMCECKILYYKFSIIIFSIFAATDIVVFVSVDIFKEVLIRENEGSSLWYVVST